MSKDARNQDKHPFGRRPKKKPCHKKKTDNSFADNKKKQIRNIVINSQNGSFKNI